MSTHPHIHVLMCGFIALFAGCGYFPSDEEIADPDHDGVWDPDDCDNYSSDINPKTDEVPYDGIDNDCNPTTLDADADLDGHEAVAAGGDDCADDDAEIYPGAPDVVDASDTDENCDGVDGVDDDQDGYASTTSGGPDCDDTNPDVNPDAVEVCDEIDNDCDGDTDTSATDADTWYIDLDGDSAGDSAASTSSCTQPDNFVSSSDDCDDGNAAVHPGAEEMCGDGIDQDCVDGDTPCDEDERYCTTVTDAVYCNDFDTEGDESDWNDARTGEDDDETLSITRNTASPINGVGDLVVSGSAGSAWTHDGVCAWLGGLEVGTNLRVSYQATARPGTNLRYGVSLIATTDYSSDNLDFLVGEYEVPSRLQEGAITYEEATLTAYTTDSFVLCFGTAEVDEFVVDDLAVRVE